MAREVEVKRNTKETQIKFTLELDSSPARYVGTTGIGFFDHMIDAFCVHGGFYLESDMRGDLYVDGHHTVEDVGIVLGKAFAQILGDRSGIMRFGQSYIPMDESLALAVCDICGRGCLVFNADFRAERIGNYETQLTKEFFRAFAENSGITLHINLLYGENDHHKTEAIFKAVGHALSDAVKIREGGAFSTKGSLEG